MAYFYSLILIGIENIIVQKIERMDTGLLHFVDAKPLLVLFGFEVESSWLWLNFLESTITCKRSSTLFTFPTRASDSSIGDQSKMLAFI